MCDIIIINIMFIIIYIYIYIFNLTVYSNREIIKKFKRIFTNQFYKKDDLIFRTKLDILHHVYHTPLVQLPKDMLQILGNIFIIQCVRLGVTKKSIKNIFINR